MSGPKLREPTEDEDSLTAPCGRGKGGQWGAEGVPHPSCLTPRSSPPHTQPLLRLQEGTLHSWLSSWICCAPGTMKRMFAMS